MRDASLLVRPYNFKRSFHNIRFIIIRLVTIFSIAVIIVSTRPLYVAKFDAPISKIFTDAAGSATKAVRGNIHFKFWSSMNNE